MRRTLRKPIATAVWLAAGLAACTAEPESKAPAPPPPASAAPPRAAPPQAAAPQPVPPPGTVGLVVNGRRIVQDPAASAVKRERLKQEVETLQAPLKQTLEEYERNLGDREQRRILEGKFRAGSAAYNEKVLSLVKEELAQRQAAQK